MVLTSQNNKQNKILKQQELVLLEQKYHCQLNPLKTENLW